MRPTPTETRPSTGVDLERVSQIEPPGEDGQSPSSKTNPLSPPGTKAPAGREDPTRETSASSNATAESAFKVDCEEPVSPAVLAIFFIFFFKSNK